MVGKGSEPKGSRIFQQCYLRCCKLQNLTPLTNVLPTGNGKNLDFCVDRIKYIDWPPILNALSCDLSLHSVCIRYRKQVKTVLDHIDCERLAKTVNKRAVILTKFVLSNTIEAIAQLLSNTTLLSTLVLEGLPLKIPYLNPLNESLLTNNSLQHIYLPRCLIGDAGCIALCKAVRCLPNILTLDLTTCELTLTSAAAIADLIKYQKIHRYSENWVHTLRYRLPELDSMAGLRRITLCGNTSIGDAGLSKLIEVLADDLWIKALDVQNCGLSESTAANILKLMQSNTTMVVLDLRHNPEISSESLSKVRVALRANEKGIVGQYSWIGSSTTSIDCKVKSSVVKSTITRDHVASMPRTTASKYNTKPAVIKKEKDYSEVLEEQLKEEIAHRQQLEELNQQLVDQMRQLKQEQMRLWAQTPGSSGSEQSFTASSRSFDMSSSSGSTSSVPIDHNTLSYIQQAFKDIYAFIQNNQCHGTCVEEQLYSPCEEGHKDKIKEIQPEVEEISDVDECEDIGDMRINISAKKVQSSHSKMAKGMRISNNKITKSAHLLGSQNMSTRQRDAMEVKPEMIEKPMHMGDTKHSYIEEQTGEIMSIQTKPTNSPKKNKKSVVLDSPTSSVVSDSSDTLVLSPPLSDSPALNPREALYSSSDDEDSP